MIEIRSGETSYFCVGPKPMVAVMPVDQMLIEMPGGPSTSRREGIPSRGKPGHVPAWPTPLGEASGPPCSKAVFSSNVIWLRSLSTRAFPVTTGTNDPVCAKTAAPAARSAANTKKIVVLELIRFSSLWLPGRCTGNSSPCICQSISKADQVNRVDHTTRRPPAPSPAACCSAA